MKTIKFLLLLILIFIFSVPYSHSQVNFRNGATISAGATATNLTPIPSFFFGLQVNLSTLGAAMPTPGGPSCVVGTQFCFGLIRYWDFANAVELPFIFPTNNTPNWTVFDPWMAYAKTNGLKVILNMGRTPDWASRQGSRCIGAGNPTSTCAGPADFTCAYSGTFPTPPAGECWSNIDLTDLGTGTDATYIDLVTQTANHLAGLNPATNVQTAIWEPWNESNISGMWGSGLTAPLVRMTDDVIPAILAANSHNAISSPNTTEWNFPLVYGVAQYQGRYYSDGNGDPSSLAVNAYSISAGVVTFTFSASGQFVPQVGSVYTISGTGNAGLDGKAVSVLNSPAATNVKFSSSTSAVGSSSAIFGTASRISVFNNTNFISIHSYMAMNGSTGQFPCIPGPVPACQQGVAPPEELVNLIAHIHHFVPTWPNYSIIDTELSWGLPNSSFCDPDMRKAFVSRNYLIGWALGLYTMDWYHYDDSHNCSIALATPTSGGDSSCLGLGYPLVPGVTGWTECPAGIAYQQTYLHMVGNIMDIPCNGPIPPDTKTTVAWGTWGCHFRNANGTVTQAIWNTDPAYTCASGVCPTLNVTFLLQPYTKYYTVDTATPVTIGGGGCAVSCVVPVGAKPIFLSN